MKERLTLALPKGRLLDSALGLLREIGVDGIDADSRKLIFTDPTHGLKLLFLKPADVPAYVTYGAADLGIVGKDILLEQEPDVYEPLDLGFGFCRLVVAELRTLWERDDPAKWSWVRVATKYPRLTEEYFSARGIQVEIVRLDGSIELAPLVGLAERIVDLVQSGETLRANGLVEVAEITRSTARVIVNRASMKTEHAAGTRLIDEHGSSLGQELRPLDRVGIYIPGGRAAYPSTVLMTAVPARVAGVKQIVLVTPPDAAGRVDPVVLAAARVAGVTEGWRIGGAQAVAARAYGTATLRRVAKIAGPGHVSVALAE